MNAAVDHPRPERFWPGILLVILLVLLLLQRLPYAAADQRFLYWYAAEFRADHGMVFNPGQPVLLIASPLYILLLTGVQLLFPGMVASTGIIFVFALAISANSLFRIGRRIDLSYTAASIAAALYLTVWPVVWSGQGTEFPVVAALCFLALDLALADRWRIAGVIFAAAILCSPEAILYALPVLIFAASKRAGRRFGLTLLLPLVVAGLGLYLYYGAGLWNGLFILNSESPGAIWIPALIYLPLVIFVVGGWYRQRINPVVSLFGVWITLSILVLVGLLRVPIYHLAAIIGPMALLVMVGLRELKVPAFVGYPTVIVLGLLSIVWGVGFYNSPIIDLGSVSNRGISRNSTIGVQQSSEALVLRSSPDQIMISFDGQLQPDLKAMIERGDIQSALIKYAPDVLLAYGSGRIQPKMLSTGAWARLNYQSDSESGLYRRTRPIGQFVDQPVSAPYGLDIRLTGMALDQVALSPGQLLRVRLDWDYVRSASTPVTVELRLESGEYVLAYAQDTYEPSIFRAGKWSTYHTLTVDSQAWPGPVTLTVGVIINNGTAGRAPLAILPITAH